MSSRIIQQQTGVVTPILLTHINRIETEITKNIADSSISSHNKNSSIKNNNNRISILSWGGFHNNFICIW